MLNEVHVSDIPKTLKELRVQQGKTLRDLATPCGVSPTTILRWETRGAVSLDNVNAYAKALGVNKSVVFRIIGPRLVQSREDAKEWVDAVAASAEDRLIKLLLLTIWLFLDEEAYDVLVTPSDVASRAREDEMEVLARWDDVLDSGFVVQRSDKHPGELFVLRLSFPFDLEP